VAVARTQHHQVARNQRTYLDLLARSVANDCGGRLEQAVQRATGALRLIFLEKAQQGIDQDHDHDDGKIGNFAHRQRDRRNDQNDADQRAFELGQEDHPDRWGLRHR
jgi:hypothetical protein